MFARSDGDAHASVAAGVGGAIADEDASAPHGLGEFRVLRADENEHKVCLGGPIVHTEAVERGGKLFTSRKYFADVPINVGLIG